MVRTLRFYKRDTRWYAYIPEYIEAGGTEEECEMVGGSDEWLDLVSDFSDTVVVKLSGTEPLQEKLSLYNYDEFGATYVACEYKEEIVNQQMWLCPVTLFVFGEYPDTIYYQIIK